ncbi:MAG: hypothetical protein DDT19_01880 [Syntrophomonadaceae bacterium]|nr:hypothetical protein [Bacillota bacterium]
MNTIIAVCLIFVTVSVLVATIFLVMTLVQMKKTAAEAETLLKTLNSELKALENFSKFIGSLSLVKFFSSVVGVVSGLGIFRRKKA